ncbi:sulfotransferase [Stenotrophomonas sp. Marseille-Q4652]|uniref:sulfotransferase family protein n=1 Tax=Stenotrophomonas sp. Marseille-Q4652 TaxID=2866595 RepID=UPI001CE45A55|nr:sulfotransferase [Stenotrophomonas sp. Marseille-Q4652]
MIASLRQSPGWQDAELLAALDRLDDSALHQARARYWHAVRRHVPETGLQLVDKYPLTLTRVPYVARLFPRAHWLLLLRHPCDCVLSCHMQAFGLNGGVLAFENLDSTAWTYDRVMTYWETQRQRVVTPVHVLRYEDMVRTCARRSSW